MLVAGPVVALTCKPHVTIWPGDEPGLDNDDGGDGDDDDGSGNGGDG